MKPIKENEGFSIVESLISILLLAIVLAGGMSFYFNSSAIMAQVAHKKMAMEIANQAMEKKRIATFSSLTATGWVDDDTPIVSFGDFSTQVRKKITNMVGTPPYKQVEIEVSWTEPGQQSQSTIALATYMAP